MVGSFRAVDTNKTDKSIIFDVILEDWLDFFHFNVLQRIKDFAYFWNKIEHGHLVVALSFFFF